MTNNQFSLFQRNGMLEHLKYQTLNKMRSISGWFSDDEASWLFDRASERRYIIEVGCYKGRSTIVLANAVGVNPIPRQSAVYGLPPEDPMIGGLVISIDPFKAGPDDPKGEFYKEYQTGEGRADVINQFLLNTARERERGNLILMEMDFAGASIYLNPLLKYRRADMIFIDGSHDKASVLEDLDVAQRLLAPNGLLCGHDYHSGGVAAAVNSYFPQRETVPGTSLWWVVPRPYYPLAAPTPNNTVAE